MYENKSENRRRQRETEQFQLRQQRREEALNKKRSTAVSETSRIQNFVTLKNNLMSGDLKEVFKGTYEFRMLLSVETLPPIQDVIETNLVPRFVELLSPNNVLYKNGDPDLARNTRLEAAWVLTNIASGTSSQTKVVVDCGAIPLLLQMLREDNDLVDQAVWALGNIAGDSEPMRDAIIHCNSLGLVIQLFNKEDMKIVRNATWLLSNLCRGRNPSPDMEHLRSCLPVFVHLMALSDTDVICDSFWALSYICEIDPSLLIGRGSSEEEKATSSGVDSECYGDVVLDKARALLEQGTPRMVGPVIRMLGNIATGDEFQTDAIVAKGFLPLLKQVFYGYGDHRKLGRIRKEICWTVSNVCAGTRGQAEAVLDSGLLPMLIEALNLPEMYVRVEACWAITNCIDYLCLENLDRLVSDDLLREMKEFLVVSGSMAEVQAQILDAFKKMLLVGNDLERKTGRNVVREKFLELDVAVEIEDLQVSRDKAVSDRAHELVSEFFEDG